MIAGALAAAPGAVPAYKEAARVKIALGRAMEAMGDAATAAALAPDDPDAQALNKEVTVARALAYLSDPNQAGLAIPDLQALIQQDPESVVAYVGLAQAHLSQQQPDEAQAALDRALALEPENPAALYWQGHLRLAMRNDFAGAVEPLGKAVAGDPANVKYRTEYGLALKQVQQYPEAIAELKKVTESPGYEKADAWMFLGEAQVGAQQYKGAVASLSKAAEIAGEVARIEAMLGWAYFGLKDAANFKKHAGKARELGYDEATLLQYLKRIEGGEAIK
jgi:tetratricopeptide (TPR) repeat protein